MLCGRVERPGGVRDGDEDERVRSSRRRRPANAATEATWRTGLDGVSRACASLRAFADRRAGAGSTPRKMIAFGRAVRASPRVDGARRHAGRTTVDPEAAERAFDAALAPLRPRTAAAWTRAAPEGTEGAESADPGRVEGADRVARESARASEGRRVVPEPRARGSPSSPRVGAARSRQVRRRGRRERRVANARGRRG